MLNFTTLKNRLTDSSTASVWQSVSRSLILLLVLLSFAAFTEILYAFFDFVFYETGLGDFAAYYVAGAVLNSNQPVLYDPQVQEAVSEAIDFSYRDAAYIYPPFLAVLFRPIASGMSFLTACALWTLMNLLLQVLVAYFLVKIVNLPYSWKVYTATTLIIFIFPPVYYNTFIVCKINLVILSFLLVAYYYSRPESTISQQVVAGVALGIATGIKLLTAPFIVYFWLFRARRVAIIALLSVALTLLVGVVGGGWNNTIYFFTQELPRLQGIEKLLWINHSVTTTIQRLFVPYSWTFESYSLPSEKSEKLDYL